MTPQPKIMRIPTLSGYYGKAMRVTCATSIPRCASKFKSDSTTAIFQTGGKKSLWNIPTGALFVLLYYDVYRRARPVALLEIRSRILPIWSGVVDSTWLPDNTGRTRYGSWQATAVSRGVRCYGRGAHTRGGGFGRSRQPPTHGQFLSRPTIHPQRTLATLTNRSLPSRTVREDAGAYCRIQNRSGRVIF